MRSHTAKAARPIGEILSSRIAPATMLETIDPYAHKYHRLMSMTKPDDLKGMEPMDWVPEVFRSMIYCDREGRIWEIRGEEWVLRDNRQQGQL
jgi:hypothetical protein